MAFNDNLPETLNGYPVLATARLGMRDLVIVKREGHPVHPYVAATWDGQEAWHWGNYCKTFKEALEIYPDVLWHKV